MTQVALKASFRLWSCCFGKRYHHFACYLGLRVCLFFPDVRPHVQRDSGTGPPGQYPSCRLSSSLPLLIPSSLASSFLSQCFWCVAQSALYTAHFLSVLSPWPAYTHLLPDCLVLGNPHPRAHPPPARPASSDVTEPVRFLLMLAAGYLLLGTNLVFANKVKLLERRAISSASPHPGAQTGK